MLWVNLLMDSLASLSLATEKPSNELLNRRPYKLTQPLISGTMLWHIVSHSVYQLAVLLILLFLGQYYYYYHVRNATRHITLTAN